MSSYYMSFLGSGKVPGPLGTAFPTVVPYRVYHADDRPVSIAIGSERLWSIFCGVIERRGPRDASRLCHQSAAGPQSVPALDAELGTVFRQRSAAGLDCAHACSGHTVLSGPHIREVASDPQTAIRNMFPTIDYCRRPAPRDRTASEAFRNARRASARPRQNWGEHTAEVLSELLGVERGNSREPGVRRSHSARRPRGAGRIRIRCTCKPVCFAVNGVLREFR